VNDATPRTVGELFELEMLGGSWEKHYRKLRPEVEAMPWGTLDPKDHPEALVLAARRSWTGAAFQEHRTGAACAETLRCLIECRAPLDLIAVASRFPLDEMVHVELCARLAMELGGGTEIVHDPDDKLSDADRAHLAGTAVQAIAGIHTLWADIERRPKAKDSSVHALGWMQSEAYLALARHSMGTKVLAPLRERGIVPAI